MLTNAYLQIQQLLPQLADAEQRQLVEEIKKMIEGEETEPLHDIMEFEGFAEELWKDVNVEAYLKEI